MQRKNWGTAVKFYHIDFKISRITLGAFLFSPSHVSLPYYLRYLYSRTNLQNLTNMSANIQKTPTCVERTMISIYFVSYTSIFWIFNTKRKKLESDKCLQTRYLQIDFTHISLVQSKWQIVLLYSRQQSL